MQAKELMTTDVVAVGADTPVNEIARLLLAHGISAVPVLDAAGEPIGMVSEGDLIGRDERARDARRDWWLSLLAEGEALNREFLESIHPAETTARHIMAAPVVTVSETADAREIAQVLAEYRIKRVPVVRDDGHIVGIISRADLLRALMAADTSSPAGHDANDRPNGLVARTIEEIDRHFLHPRNHNPDGSRNAPANPVLDDAERNLSAANLRRLVADFEHGRAVRHDRERQKAVLQRRARVKELIDHHIEDRNWQAILHRAHDAAEKGKTSLMILRFPSQLCSDGGRAVNAPTPDWPSTLRGEAAELYLRWAHELKPRGFRLNARVLEFPGGMPGDIGLFLVWDE